MTILVVEDEIAVAELIQEVLGVDGHRCLHASNTLEADHILESDEVDAVTLDTDMPGRSGLQWFGTLAVKRPDLARRTLVFTGTNLSPEGHELLERYGAGYLVKPAGVEQIREAFHRQLVRAQRPPAAKS